MNRTRIARITQINTDLSWYICVYLRSSAVNIINESILFSYKIINLKIDDELKIIIERISTQSKIGLT